MASCLSFLREPRVARQPFSPAQRLRVLEAGQGRCHHCRIGLTGTFHVDHYPIPRRDVVNQMCCGVTDVHDDSNLVPSCVSCNVGHRFEGGDTRAFCCKRRCCAWWTACGCSGVDEACSRVVFNLFCRRTQPPCLRHHMRNCFYVCLGVLVGVLLVVAVCLLAQ